MDEDNVERFAPSITPTGIAALWLKGNVEAVDQELVESLAGVIEAVLTDGVRQGTANALKALETEPDMQAAISSLEADLIELEHAFKRRRVEGKN